MLSVDDELANHLLTLNYIGGVMVGMLALRAVDCGFISGVMVSVLALRAVDCGFKPRSGETKNCEIGNCCFSAKHAA